MNSSVIDMDLLITLYEYAELLEAFFFTYFCMVLCYEDVLMNRFSCTLIWQELSIILSNPDFVRRFRILSDKFLFDQC